MLDLINFYNSLRSKRVTTRGEAEKYLSQFPTFKFNFGLLPTTKSSIGVSKLLKALKGFISDKKEMQVSYIIGSRPYMKRALDILGDDDINKVTDLVDNDYYVKSGVFSLEDTIAFKRLLSEASININSLSKSILSVYIEKIDNGEIASYDGALDDVISTIESLKNPLWNKVVEFYKEKAIKDDHVA